MSEEPRIYDQNQPRIDAVDRAQVFGSTEVPLLLPAHAQPEKDAKKTEKNRRFTPRRLLATGGAVLAVAGIAAMAREGVYDDADQHRSLTPPAEVAPAPAPVDQPPTPPEQGGPLPNDDEIHVG